MSSGAESDRLVDVAGECRSLLRVNEIKTQPPPLASSRLGSAEQEVYIVVAKHARKGDGKEGKQIRVYIRADSTTRTNRNPKTKTRKNTVIDVFYIKM